MPHSMIWLETDEIIRKVPCTCIDGRTQGMRYSVAGGSFGLILHTLALVQAHRMDEDRGTDDFSLSTEDISAYIALFARAVGPVYLHSDQTAITKILAQLGVPPDTRLTALTPGQQKTFVQLAAEPELQGCGHIKLMMLQPELYGVPTVLIKRALQAFLWLYFAGEADLLFEVLKGDHHEAAVLLADPEHPDGPGVGPQTALFMAAPLDDDRFFCHRPLKQTLIARFLDAIRAAGLANLPADAGTVLLARHNEAALHTLGALAPHLPIERIRL